MIENKEEMIQLLTGVKSSRRNYYNELKKNILEIQKKNMQLEIINEVVKSFNVDMSLDDMLQNVAHKLRRILSFTRLSLSTLEKGELVISNVYPQKLTALPPGTVLEKENSLYWKAIQGKKAVIYHISTTPETDSMYTEEKVLRNFSISQLLLIPLFSKRQAIGVVSLGCSIPFTYDESDLAFLQQLADQLAVCIENARLYNEVLQGKKEWEKTFSAVTDLLLYIDMDYTILRFNQAVSTFLRIPEEDIYGQKYYKLLYGSDFSYPICPLTESYQSQQTVYCQLTLVGNRICDIFVYPVLDEENRMYGAILYIKDVTKKLHIEAQLIQSGKLAAIGEMAAGIAHELNNPLTAILGNTQLLLRDKETNSPEQQLLHSIFNCGKRCKSIIQNLLTFSRQDDYLFHECSLNLAVEQVLSLVSYQIEKNNIRIITEFEPDLHSIEGNQQQIEQIILNLLLNAKDALSETREENKIIVIRTGNKKTEQGDLVFLQVQDNGCGIKEREMGEIFHPFFTTKELQKGTGLGLSVSLGIAKSHGGTIEVESKAGNGSTFTLLLPISGKEDA
ncbi:sensor histidine kinase [Aneurinibacillus terranovensis]|uniref:sensor histidine kinase n=1 Tax=Aneurinibacillus terranovensis TaxID=278991 RepID=UPI0004019868|nr:ATP-binding protein [Aneurinibacillus terranovensis]